MATISKLQKILAILAEAGHADLDICAEHDQLFLAPPDMFDEDSEVGKKLDEAGASYNDTEGWYIFT